MSNFSNIHLSSRAFNSVALYIQGPGEIYSIFRYSAEYGRRIIFIADDGVMTLIREKIESIPDKCSMEYGYLLFSGECCSEYIQELSVQVSAGEYDVVCGLGGGKVLDTVKLVAGELGLPRIIVPTSASNDSPAANWAALYTSDGVHISGVPVKGCTELVLADSEIIAGAPARLFAAGIGDAYATWYEAEAVRRSSSPNMLRDYTGTCTSTAVSRACRDILDEKGVEAYKAVKLKKLTPAVEDVIEANILLSGLGFVNAGLAGAHGYHSGISAIKSTGEYLHGEKVAFGLLCQLAYENADTEEIKRVARFFTEIELPVTLGQLGAELSDDNLRLVSEHMLSVNHLIDHEGIPATSERIEAALTAADKIGRDVLNEA